MKSLNIFLFSIFIFTLCGCNLTNKKDKIKLTISIAASVNNAMEEIVKEYENINPHLDIKINSGGSGTLEQQITGGASVDLYLSASKKNMDSLEEKGFLDNDTRKNILTNSLVLIGNKQVQGRIKQISDLKNSNLKIALGELSTVPAGKYAKQAFTKQGLWTAIEKKIIYQKDVTAVSNIVNMGEIEVGVVYKSDVRARKNIFIIESFLIDAHDSIVYPVAVLKNSKNKSATIDFIKYLASDKGTTVFKKYGFSL